MTITRDFEIASIETTRAVFQQLGGGQPWKTEQQEPACKDQCPAEVTWVSAIAACNALSRQRGLPECYACGERLFDDVPFPIFACDGGPRSTFFACRGYRLPSAAEWEYAAKAGAHTPLPNGTPTVCEGAADPLADAIAWYKHNADGTLHAAGVKAPNGWGLYDVAGNAAEWVSDMGGRSPRLNEILARLLAGGLTTEEAVALHKEYGSEARRVATAPAVDPLAYPNLNRQFLWVGQAPKGGSFRDEVRELFPAGGGGASSLATFRCVRTRTP